MFFTFDEFKGFHCCYSWRILLSLFVARSVIDYATRI